MMMEANSIFYLHFAACAFMAGVIWVVQLILYPAFADVEPGRFKKFHAMHSARISLVVAPAMLLELATSIALLFQNSSSWVWRFNVAAIIFLWLCTSFLSVPIHNQLGEGFDLQRIKKLILTNWPRTILWTLRLVLLSGLLVANPAGLGLEQ